MQQSFGEYIRQLREEQKMPLRKLAAQLDIDQSTLSKIERNERKAVSSMIPILANIFELDYKKLKVRFLSDNIVNYLCKEDFPIEVLKVAEQKIEYLVKQKA
jgi:transcriptional regulator with XRE-family HTH domain